MKSSLWAEKEGNNHGKFDRRTIWAAYSAFRRSLKAALRHGAWPKLDEQEKINLIIACVKEELFNLPTKRTLWEIFPGR